MAGVPEEKSVTSVTDSIGVLLHSGVSERVVDGTAKVP
jgi:hypothetical protein